MKYDEMLNHYTKEYEKYLNMGLSKEDAITLIEKRVKEDKQIKKASPYDLINLFAGYDVWKDTFASFEREMNTLMEQITKCLEYPNKKEEKAAENPSKSEPFVVDKKEEKTPIRVEEKNGLKKEIIADTPKHKEFRVTYPNGYYKYKMLMK